MDLNIITFNWHAPYLYLLSKIGHKWLIVEPEVASGRVKQWEWEMRPLPENAQIISEEIALKILNQGKVDLILAHNIKDLIFVRDYQLPKIMVFHNKLITELGLSSGEIDRKDYLNKIAPYRKGVKEVFISESKRSDWGGKGDIITPGIDISEYGGYTGEIPTVLRVGNHFKERDLMLGYSISQQIVEGIPCLTLGINPSIPGTQLAKNFNELKEHYRDNRVYLNTTMDGYEDGYNLAMLEAMATGMPVVSTWNASSPIQDGMKGYISRDTYYLSRCVGKLLKDPVLAAKIGAKGRETILNSFGLSDFVNKWKRIMNESVLDFLKQSGVSFESEDKPFYEKEKKNILMDYVSYPITTAHYLERALRRKHNVVTCGSKITNHLIKLWQLENLNWPIHDHDLSRKQDEPISKILLDLPSRWKPDLYLWVETGLDKLPRDLKGLDIPKACYLIDTHLHLEDHLVKARYFDYVFLAQKEYIEAFKEIGCKYVYWLPLGCDPEIHEKHQVEKKYDVGFVGSLTDKRRLDLLNAVDKNFDLFVERRFMEEMAIVFSESRIVFNNAINNDLNMRVFEALCSGSLLLTDSAVGLEEFFHNKTHLVIYKDEKELIEKIRFYLDHPELSVEIGEQGRNEVLKKHTYDHRIQKMMKILDGCIEEKEQSNKVNQEVGYTLKKPEGYFDNIRLDLVELVPKDAFYIMDVGCATGKLGEEIKKRRQAFVVGVEQNPEISKQARNVLDDVLEGNIEKMDLPYEKHCFDCIILADILEHLVDPLSILKILKNYLKPDGTIIASIPNVQYLGIIGNLIEGRWTYQDEGILDREHLRFFTKIEITKLFDAAGYEVTSWMANLEKQYEQFKNTDTTVLKFGRVTIRDLTKEEMQNFFIQQFKVVASPKLTNLEIEKYKVEIDTSDLNLMLGEARELEARNDIMNAENSYNCLLGRFPDCVEALAGLGNCKMKTQQAGLAEDYFNRALEIDPSFTSAMIGLALLDLNANQPTLAMDGFYKILRLKPNHDRALCGIGMAYDHLGNKTMAYDFYVKALHSNIENLSALTSLLTLSYKLNRFEEINKAIRNYLDRHPANLNMLFGLAGVQYQLGRLDEALDILNQILMFQSDHKDANQMMEKIGLEQLSI